MENVQKMNSLIVNCFSIRNNGGYSDLVSLHENEELDKADFHLFVDELAEELTNYNELLAPSSKVSLTKKDAIVAAIKEAMYVTRPAKDGKRIVRTVEYVTTIDRKWDLLLDGKYQIEFAS